MPRFPADGWWDRPSLTGFILIFGASDQAAFVAAPKMPFTPFRRDVSGAWQVRFSAGGAQVRRSLGTLDRGEAERLALQA